MNTLAFIGLLASIGVPLYILFHIHIFMDEVHTKLKNQSATNRQVDGETTRLYALHAELKDRVEELESAVKGK